MIYELREYVAHDNAVQQVHDRFATKALPLFVRHGLEVVGFWADKQEPNHILYLLRFEDVAAQKRAWEGFKADKDWTKAKADSELAGPIIAQMTSRNLQPVPYWPAATAVDDKEGNR